MPEMTKETELNAMQEKPTVQPDKDPQEISVADLDKVAGGSLTMNHNQNESAPAQHNSDGEKRAGEPVKGDQEIVPEDLDSVVGGSLTFNHNQNF